MNRPARPLYPPKPTTRDRIARNIHALAVALRAHGAKRDAETVNIIAAAVKAGQL